MIQRGRFVYERVTADNGGVDNLGRIRLLSAENPRVPHHTVLDCFLCRGLHGKQNHCK